MANQFSRSVTSPLPPSQWHKGSLSLPTTLLYDINFLHRFGICLVLNRRSSISQKVMDAAYAAKTNILAFVGVAAMLERKILNRVANMPKAFSETLLARDSL